MINKNKLKKFLKSNYSTQTKLFVLDVLRNIVETFTENSQYVIYISDLNIFEDEFIKFPNSYFVIDFEYLESLDSKIREYYYMLLSLPFNVYNNSINNSSILVEHGVLLTNIEHLKMKRQKKLEKVNKKDFDEQAYRESGINKRILSINVNNWERIRVTQGNRWLF